MAASLYVELNSHYYPLFIAYKEEMDFRDFHNKPVSNAALARMIVLDFLDEIEGNKQLLEDEME